MLDIFLILMFGFFRSLYISFVNGFILWILFKLLEQTSIVQPIPYLTCVLVSFIPGFIVACIKLYKQMK